MTKIDLLPFIIGDGRGHILNNNRGGSPEVIRFIDLRPGEAIMIKGYPGATPYEHWAWIDDYIGAGLDTSAGLEPGTTWSVSNLIYYENWEDASKQRLGTRRYRRFMAVGEAHQQRCYVQRRRWRDGTLLNDAFTGTWEGWQKLFAFHPRYKFASDLVLDNVIEMHVHPGSPDSAPVEKYLFALHRGLVGFESLANNHNGLKTWYAGDTTEKPLPSAIAPYGHDLPVVAFAADSPTTYPNLASIARLSGTVEDVPTPVPDPKPDPVPDDAQSVIGFSVDWTKLSAEQKAAIIEYVRILQPTVMSVINGVDAVREIRKVSPRTLVESRLYQSEEGKYWQKHSNYEAWSDVVNSGLPANDPMILVSFNNEPSLVDDNRQALPIESLLQWEMDAIDTGRGLGYRYVTRWNDSKNIRLDLIGNGVYDNILRKMYETDSALGVNIYGPGDIRHIGHPQFPQILFDEATMRADDPPAPPIPGQSDPVYAVFAVEHLQKRSAEINGEPLEVFVGEGLLDEVALYVEEKMPDNRTVKDYFHDNFAVPALNSVMRGPMCWTRYAQHMRGESVGRWHHRIVKWWAENRHKFPWYKEGKRYIHGACLYLLSDHEEKRGQGYDLLADEEFRNLLIQERITDMVTVSDRVWKAVKIETGAGTYNYTRIRQQATTSSPELGKLWRGTVYDALVDERVKPGVLPVEADGQLWMPIQIAFAPEGITWNGWVPIAYVQWEPVTVPQEPPTEPPAEPSIWDMVQESLEQYEPGAILEASKKLYTLSGLLSCEPPSSEIFQLFATALQDDAWIADRRQSPVSFATDGWGSGWSDASPFGEIYFEGTSREAYHTGVDLNFGIGPYDDLGLPVYATANGIVLFQDFIRVWGNVTIIVHTLPDGSRRWSRYGHMQNVTVRVGQRVEVGQSIGQIGTGDPNNKVIPHLHYDVMRNYNGPGDWPGRNLAALERDYVNPLYFILDSAS